MSRLTLLMLHQAVSQNRGCARFVAWALLLSGLLFLARVVYDVRLVVTGAVADGVITKVTEHVSSGSSQRRKGETDASYAERTRHGGVSYRLTVRYTPAGGQPVEFVTSSTFGHELKTGDAVKVIYRAANPANAEIWSVRQVWLPLCTGVFVTLVTLVFGGVLLRTVRES